MQTIRWKKHQIFEQSDDFENRPSCKGNSLCKGYSHCKIVNLGQKLKWPKTCAKRLYKNTRVVLCKKPLEKKHQIFEKNDFENRPSCKGYCPRKGYSIWKMFSLGQKLKRPKTCAKRLYKKTRVVPVQKTAGKHTKYSRSETILKIGHLARAMAHAKAKAFAKIFSLGQKLKWPKTCTKRLYKKTRVVLCKKPAGKKHQIFEKWDDF